VKEIQFYVLITVLAALEGGLVLAGILPPISSYSIGTVILSLAGLAAVAYMGRAFSNEGIKKVAIKGTIAGTVSIAIILLSAAIGIMVNVPVLGMSIPSAYLPLAFISIAVPNIILFTIFAVFGALIAKKLHKNA